MKKTIKLFLTAALLIACIVAVSLPTHASTDLSECVPLSAVSCWFTGSDGRVYIGLDAGY